MTAYKVKITATDYEVVLNNLNLVDDFTYTYMGKFFNKYNRFPIKGEDYIVTAIEIIKDEQELIELLKEC